MPLTEYLLAKKPFKMMIPFHTKEKITIPNMIKNAANRMMNLENLVFVQYPPISVYKQNKTFSVVLILALKLINMITILHSSAYKVKSFPLFADNLVLNSINNI